MLYMGNCNELWPVRPSPEIKPEKYPTPSWACPASTPSEKPRSNCLVGWKDWGGYDYDKQIGTAFKHTNAKLVPSINFDPNDGLNNLISIGQSRKKWMDTFNIVIHMEVGRNHHPTTVYETNEGYTRDDECATNPCTFKDPDGNTSEGKWIIHDPSPDYDHQIYQCVDLQTPGVIIPSCQGIIRSPIASTWTVVLPLKIKMVYG